MRKILPLVLSVLLTANASAGFVDRVNGVTVGKKLLAHELRYLGATPETKGKVLLIDFWATWCAPCLAAMPELAKIQEDYRARGLVVISVTKEGAKVVEPFLQRTPRASSLLSILTRNSMGHCASRRGLTPSWVIARARSSGVGNLPN